jgi:two-component sensor histidine kinase
VNAASRENEAEQAASSLSLVLDSLQANVVLCDADLRVVTVNAAARALIARLEPALRQAYGVGAADAVGLSLKRFLKDPERDGAILSDPALLPYSFEFGFGPTAYSARVAALLSPRGEVSGYTVVCEDVTRRREAESDLDSALRERATLVHAVSGRVRHCLGMLSDLARLEFGPQVGAWSSLLAALSRVHELLLAADDVSAVDLDAFVSSLAHAALAAHGPADGRLRVETAVRAELPDLDRLIAFGLVIDELVANSVLHAFPDGRAGVVRVTARSVDGAIQATVTDDGVGLPADHARRSGLGLKVVRALIETRLHGEWKLESRGGGMACLFSIPARD